MRNLEDTVFWSEPKASQLTFWLMMMFSSVVMVFELTFRCLSAIDYDTSQEAGWSA